ncbi:1-acyl-sn-glycerol-3-phosphate acyltransferase [Aureibacter tunicatorum]|uniref:Glycerol-3-phosphate acyltransferase n=1 Tax=Aureibacter tunicatorum TaxID=866807 RepID=A0AAE3XR34_9BACT|nr:1-acyl-sn-glycerol-3-phosphate acyltransferase [Aureibacter tunicatorum]MDR6241057.1 glycerol-3-phosphate O-acyltransferase [Aureibacter tunicatorum]BDD03835.1 hypothetical protein AUTU_13180 [Aureibacter tunicatorum]
MTKKLDVQATRSRTKKYEPILPGTKDWPVVWMAKHRKEFVEQVIEESFSHILSLKPNVIDLIEELELTLFKEKTRITQNPWVVDPEDEKAFWSGIKKQLIGVSKSEIEPGGADEKVAKQVLKAIVGRYAEEVAGNFKPSHYKMTRSLVTFGLTRFLNGARLKGIDRFFKSELSLMDKIQIVGEVDDLRKLAKLGTIVMVPTHFSNLDSVLIGWVISTLGLPPLIYGAGLNLFNIQIFAYFMNSLGAYKVDRRKKNLIYIETLKMYSSLAIRKGIHSLFFPGGTRSRSGKIEDRLKLGLLGTAIEAQRKNIQEKGEDAEKVFVVPMTLNYNFVLEAPSLIDDYLKIKGQERYYAESDEFSSSAKILNFIFKFMTKGGNISVSIGKPMDLFGNYVNGEGQSFDKYGRELKVYDYFRDIEGNVTTDLQREKEYTKMLAGKIVHEFHRINRVSASHLASFTAFYMLRKRHKKLDLYNFLRLSDEDLVINNDEFKATFKKMRDVVYETYKAGKIDIANHLTGDLDEVIEMGLKNCGMYHPKLPLVRNRQNNITTEDVKTLYYYSNRLKGYGFEKYI